MIHGRCILEESPQKKTVRPRVLLAFGAVPCYDGAMHTQKGLNKEDVVVLTDDTKEFAWVQVGFPGYEELTVHFEINADADLKEMMNSEAEKFHHMHRSMEFSYEVPELPLPFDLTDDEDLNKLLAKMHGVDLPTQDSGDSWGSVLNDIKGNLGNKANTLKDSVKENIAPKAAAFKEGLNERIRTRFTKKFA